MGTPLLRICSCFLWLIGDFKDNFEFDRQSQRKTGDAEDDPRRNFLKAEYVAEQVRYSVGDLGLIEEVAVSRDEDAESDDTANSIKRA